MKVGDLVELSASGRNVVYCQNFRDKKGLIVEVRSKAIAMYPIVVQWFGANRAAHLRSQLKYISKAKKTLDKTTSM